MKRITLVIPSLACGGAERNLSMMANYFATHGSNVTLITLAAAETDFFQLHPQIERVALNLLRVSTGVWDALKSNWQRLRRLRQAIKNSQPETVISLMDRTNTLTLLATIGLTIPVIVMEQTDPRQRDIGWLWHRLRRWLYPRASAIVVLTEELREWANQFVSREEKIHVIPNPVAISEQTTEAALSRVANKCVLAGMGRLVPSKGFNLLLRAFAQCANQHPEWTLTIFGEGEERRHLEMLAADLKISSCVNLPGLTPNPMRSLSGADLFVMTSQYEGFPLSLLEAMACGVPVISFDCPTGPRQIIREGVDGLLIPLGDIDTLAAAMHRLMSDQSARERMGQRAKEVIDRFGLEQVMRLWEKTLARVKR